MTCVGRIGHSPENVWCDDQNLGFSCIARYGILVGCKRTFSFYERFDYEFFFRERFGLVCRGQSTGILYFRVTDGLCIWIISFEKYL